MSNFGARSLDYGTMPPNHDGNDHTHMWLATIQAITFTAASAATAGPLYTDLSASRNFIQQNAPAASSASAWFWCRMTIKLPSFFCAARVAGDLST